jgi:CheY-like chemotaxis protein
MAHIIVVDDDPSAAAFMKQVLASNGHQVTSVGEGWGAIADTIFRADLVLINQAYRHGSGWTLFNHLKKNSGKRALMLYFLETCTLVAVRWIVEAVDEALACTRKNTSSFADAGSGRKTAMMTRGGNL